MTHPPRWMAATRLRLAAGLLVCAWLVTPLAAQPAAPPAAPPAGGQHAPPVAPAAPGHDAAVTAAAQAAPATGGGQVEAAHADPGHAAAGHEGEHHEESLFSFLSRIVNFLILAGGLFYLLRSPLAGYLNTRAEQIKADLVQAGQTRESASAELKQIEERMRALPAEVEALKARGKQEVAAEQQRIHAAAAAERERLLDQARREVDQQLQGARRALKQEVAELAVGIARLRVTHEITDQDRARLLDRYVSQVKAAHE